MAVIRHSLWALTPLLAMGIGLFWTLSAPAAEFTVGLYEGQAEIADQSAAQQEQGTRAALVNVLQKLSGLSNFEEYPELDTAVKSAPQMVVSFYHRNHPRLLPDGSSIEVLQLVASFSPRAVDQLRVDLQLPRWKTERQPLNIWPIVDSGLDRRVMPIELQYVWSGMADIAAYRGMPVNWPSADENDEYPVDVQLLWGGYTEELSEEGPTETLVIAALQDGPEWNVRMTLDYEGLLWSGRFRGADAQIVINQGLNQAIDQIVASQSIAASDSGDWSVDLQVDGIANAGDYARCMAYLQGLSLVDQVLVRSATAGSVRFSLILNAAPEYLQQSLQAGKTLILTEKEDVYLLQP